MAEVVGAVASVLTLCQTVTIGVSTVLELYRAPAEIRSLQVSMISCYGGLIVLANLTIGASSSFP